MDLGTKYSVCNKYSRKEPTPVRIEGEASVAANRSVMPLYEKAISDRAFVRAHSLTTNRSLRCRWLEYQRVHVAVRPPPFDFPRVSDYHFHNYRTLYKPDQTIGSAANHRRSLKVGPGVDAHGDVPIPSDVGFRRTGLMVDTRGRRPSGVTRKRKKK